MGKTLRFLEMPFLKPQTHMIYFYDKEQKKFKSLSFFSYLPGAHKNCALRHSIRNKCSALKTDRPGFRS